MHFIEWWIQIFTLLFSFVPQQSLKSNMNCHFSSDFSHCIGVGFACSCVHCLLHICFDVLPLPCEYMKIVFYFCTIEKSHPEGALNCYVHDHWLDLYLCNIYTISLCLCVYVCVHSTYMCIFYQLDFVTVSLKIWVEWANGVSAHTYIQNMHDDDDNDDNNRQAERKMKCLYESTENRTKGK